MIYQFISIVTAADVTPGCVQTFLKKRYGLLFEWHSKSEHPNHSEKEQNGHHLEFMFWLSLEISFRITIPGRVICRSLIASSIFIARTR